MITRLMPYIVLAAFISALAWLMMTYITAEIKRDLHWMRDLPAPVVYAPPFYDI